MNMNIMAEEEGFEPSELLNKVRRFSLGPWRIELLPSLAWVPQTATIGLSVTLPCIILI